MKRYDSLAASMMCVLWVRSLVPMTWYFVGRFCGSNGGEFEHLLVVLVAPLVERRRERVEC